jgi:hypothetical protein
MSFFYLGIDIRDSAVLYIHIISHYKRTTIWIFTRRTTLAIKPSRNLRFKTARGFDMTTTIANFIGAFVREYPVRGVGVSRVAEGYKRLQHRRDYSGLHNYPV